MARRAPFSRIVLKGIGAAEDAKIALECGAAYVYVSNHGGRQLDQGVGSIDVLSKVVEAVGGRARVMVGGGIYRGTDVVKALILGANIVSVGRLYIYGLSPPAGLGWSGCSRSLRTRFISVCHSRASPAMTNSTNLTFARRAQS